MPNKFKPRDIKDSYLEIKKDEIEVYYPRRIRGSENSKHKHKPPELPTHSVTDAALNYEVTDRIREMATPKRSFAPDEEEKVPGQVALGALLHETTEKDYELATPRTRNYSNEKQEPYSTSKAAMRYVASARIIELAKPAEKRF